MPLRQSAGAAILEREELTMLDLSRKVALITGASRGIGASTAIRLAQAGAAMVLSARSADPLRSLVSRIEGAGGRAVAVPCDVTAYADVERAVGAAVKTFGRLDILVNNAGLIEPIARLADSEPAAWSHVIDVNVKGVYHGLRAAIPVMVAQGGGVVVNISSGAATSALEGWSQYCSSKAAVLMLTRCADKEYRGAGLRVVGLSPGTVATDMQVAIKASGLNPVSQLDPSAHIPAEWAAEAIAWLCTEAGAPYAGTDFSLKTEEGRRLVGLVPTVAA